jgi:RNA-directed DNA polymerase
VGLVDWLRGLFASLSGPPPPPPAGRTLPPSLTAPTRPVAPPPVRPAAPAPQPKKLNLDASRFAPISDADALKSAQKLGQRWSDPFFGRRDLIPPAGSPHALLIDRGMVAHGFITPEQLVEIHKVGEEMDAVRPDLAMAHVAAERAVEAFKGDREGDEGGEEGGVRRATPSSRGRGPRRRETDITYLGRGVSKGLVDRRANIEKLQCAGLPLLASPSDVAAALTLSIQRLRWLAFQSEATGTSHYVLFNVRKKSGGMRQLAAPHAEMARCQQWILANILSKIPTSEVAHGFITGRSTVTNASVHVESAWVLNADLKDFFPSITFPRVQGIFLELGYSPAAACILALLCTECPRQRVVLNGKLLYAATGPRALPQGACTSPALSNLATRRLDARLQGISRRLGLRYTRYADDLTLSAPAGTIIDNAPEKDVVGYMLARLRHIAGEEGFRLNPDKTRVQRRHTAQVVTGIVVNDHPAISRETVRRLRAILHRARSQGLTAQNRENHPNFEGWVHGMIAYVSMVNAKQGETLRRQLEQIPPELRS